MKAEKVSEMVERFYWKCTVPSHRHREEFVAQACIDDREHIKPSRRWNCDMYADSVDALINGATLNAVGDMFGVGPSRMRQVFHKALRIMRHPSMRDVDIHFPLDMDIKEVRANSVFWLGQVKKLREKRYKGIGHNELNGTV